MVDYRLLSLLKIVETGSFTKASGQLGLSQPAVSQHIRQLEEYWQVKIFEHAHNRFTLTPEGELIVRYAQRMAALSNNLKQALKNEKEQIHSLTIGITHTAESSAIIEALAAYTNNLDRLNLKILTTPPTTCTPCSGASSWISPSWKEKSPTPRFGISCWTRIAWCWRCRPPIGWRSKP